MNEFDWKYNFNGVNGLTIDAGNVQTNSVTLNDARKPYGDTDIFTFAIDAKYLYYHCLLYTSGYGLDTMKRLTEKYHGSLQLECEGEMFMVKILLEN